MRLACVKWPSGRPAGVIARERYEVLVFEQESPWRTGQGLRVARMNAEGAEP